MYEASHWHLFIDQTERIQAVDCAGGLASSRSFAMAHPIGTAGHRGAVRKSYV